MPNPLWQESGGSPQDRTNEVIKIWGMIHTQDFSVLNEKDLEFVNSMRDRLQKYGAFTTISPRHLFWMRDIKDKVLG
jgi:hypothetical protein